jgi:hypothetical protein
VAPLDDWLPEFDVRELHETCVAAPPETALAAALGVPIAPDALVRTLFRLRGLSTGGTIESVLRGLAFAQLERSPTRLVLGAAGRPWTPRGGLTSWEKAGPGQVRMAFALWAEPTGDGSRLATETRVVAHGAKARRAFRRYWLAVGPFSALIRRRWLRAAARAVAA